MFYIYILYLKSCSLYYKGFTTDIDIRLSYHNTGKSSYTSKANDWELVYFIQMDSKRDALIEEKRIKRLNVASIERLILKFQIN